VIQAFIVVTFVIAFVRSSRRAYISIAITPIISVLVSTSVEEAIWLTILAFVTKMVVVTYLIKVSK
jgi:hypothetical protein